MTEDSAVRRLVMCAVSAAVICVVAPFSIPIGAVPLSLATLAVMLAGTLTGPLGGACSTAVYLLLGMTGLPVFSGFRGGAAVLAGPTGGYLCGYPVLAAICGLSLPLLRIVRRKRGHEPSNLTAILMIAACAVTGTVLLYAAGTAWFCAVTGMSFSKALAVCVLPFLPGDALKIAVCIALTLALRRRNIFKRRNS